MNEYLSSANCKAIIDTISDGLILVGREGVILMANQAMEELTGYSMDELVGHPCTVLNCDACEEARSQSKGNWCKIFDIMSIKGKRCLLRKKTGAYVSAIKSACLLHDKNNQLIGAFESFTDITETVEKDRKIERLTKLLRDEGGFQGIIGRSPVMQKVFQLIERTAQSDAPVIIYGETGTGKELVACAIHEMGRRRDGPFIQFNCAALPDSLVDSELFGHAKGAFTGACYHRVGRFELAHQGDIFLDEIGDIPISTQIKLLRVLEAKQFERIGSHQTIKTDVRVISATNRDLEQLVVDGKFRQDLLFRINVLPIYLPPLRERREDIPLLVSAFIKNMAQESGKALKGIKSEVMSLFMEYPWPGNVRELKSALEYAFVITTSKLIGIEHLPPHLVTGASVQNGNGESSEEKNELLEALWISRGNKTKAAEILGVHRMTVWNRMKKFGIKVSMT